MALRYPSHKISSAERYVAESTTTVTGGTLAFTDRVLVRLALNGNTNFALESGSEDGQYRILIAESIIGTMRLEPDTNVKLKDRAWLPESTGECIGLMWNAVLAQWVELWRSVTYDSFTGVYVKNNTAAIITKGSVVYINGIDGNNPTITLATNASEAGSNRTLGLVKDDIAINGFGYVISSGVVEGINTIGGTSGSSVYLGTGGAFTATKPVAPAHIVKVGNFLKINASTGSIQVDVSNGWELEELHNVLITTPTNGQVLTYDSTTSLWKNAAGGGGGGSPSIGGTITGGTAGSVLFVDPAATIAQDNLNFFWDNSTQRLGIGTSSPNQKLKVVGNIEALGDVIVTGTNNQLLAGIGSATNAAMSFFAAEADTGITSPAADAVAIQNAGIENVRVEGGGNVKIGTPATVADTKLHVEKGSAGVVTSNANTVITAENNTSAFISILTPATDDGGVLFGDPASAEQGGIVYNHANDRLDLRSNNNVTQLNANTAGVAIGLGNTIAETRLEIGGVEPYITMPTELTSASPTNPTANKLIIIGQRIANRGMLAVKGAVGHETALQPYIGHNKTAIYSAIPNQATLPTANGISYTTQIGTLTARAVAITNAATYMHRYGIVSAATLGALTHQRTGSAAAGVGYFFTGNGTNRGGFTYTVRFVVSDATIVLPARMFIGLRNDTAAPTNVAPNTFINCVGLAQYDGTAQLYIVYGGTAAQTPINLGASFVASNSTPYELALYAPSVTANTVYYEVTNLDTGAIATGTLGGTTTTAPGSTILLTGHHWRTNNTSTAAVALDICQIYVEMDQ